MYVKSEDITIYPTGYRDGYNPESRINTEYNITRPIANLLRKDTKGSFIYSYDITNKKMELCLGGYFLTLDFADYYDSLFKNKSVYAHLYYANINVNTGNTDGYSELVEIVPKNYSTQTPVRTLDQNGEFLALELDNDPTEPANAYTLHIWQGTNVAYKSLYKFNIDDINLTSNDTVEIVGPAGINLIAQGDGETVYFEDSKGVVDLDDIRAKLNANGFTTSQSSSGGTQTSTLSSSGNIKISLEEQDSLIELKADDIKFSSASHSDVTFDSILEELTTLNNNKLNKLGFSTSGNTSSGYVLSTGDAAMTLQASNNIRLVVTANNKDITFDDGRGNITVNNIRTAISDVSTLDSNLSALTTEVADKVDKNSSTTGTTGNFSTTIDNNGTTVENRTVKTRSQQGQIIEAIGKTIVAHNEVREEVEEAGAKNSLVVGLNDITIKRQDSGSPSDDREYELFTELDKLQTKNITVNNAGSSGAYATITKAGLYVCTTQYTHNSVTYNITTLISIEDLTKDYISLWSPLSSDNVGGVSYLHIFDNVVINKLDALLPAFLVSCKLLVEY